jgi:uncharacterized heparinase superfamily protein
MTSPGTYWRTLRHLKARQIIGRLIFRLGSPVPGSQPVPPRRLASGLWVPPARRAASMTAADSFRFLNVEHSIAGAGWDGGVVEKLWRYNQHYFDDLNAEGASSRHAWHVALMDRWIQQNPAADGSGWEPYPASLRIVNWVKWFLGGALARDQWLESLALQARWLSRRLEWHLLGNHLLANAKALLFAGAFFDGPEASEWTRTAVRILRSELQEQVLRDGGHFELSPMYHLLAFEDVLDLINLLSCIPVPDDGVQDLMPLLREKAGSMWAWAEIMQHEDGTLPRFNDTADGIAPALQELRRLAFALSISPPGLLPQMPVVHLADSGYVKLHWQGASAFLDVAAVGPDYLPGHAHADTLSFELSLRGRPVIVNRGTSCSGTSARRAWERGTAAHSTVEVDGRNSSEVWGGFRVGRRARPRNFQSSGGKVGCEHDGYCFLPGKPVHLRQWTRQDGGLLVEDRVTGGLPGIARYHLAPGLRLQELSSGMWVVLDATSQVMRAVIEVGEGRIVEHVHGAAFGVQLPAKTLEVSLQAGRARVRWYW